MNARSRAIFSRRMLLGGLASMAAGAALAGCGLFSEPRPGETPKPNATTPPGATPAPATPVPAANLPAADQYVAVAPKVLRAGREASVSISLQRGDGAARGAVEVRLLRGASEIARAQGDVAGRGQIGLAIPAGTSEGDYQIEVASGALRQAAPVRIEDDTLLFVETDKPIYKPGQTIHVRILTLDSRLRPVAGSAVVELADAKGIKVARRDVPTDDFGMATFDVPLSTEPNLGTWKLTARAGKRTTQRDVRVERYVLPKYEVTVDLPKEWALASDEIAGSVAAEYSFGKPVKGEVEIRALRYVGQWEEYANVTGQLDGSARFRLPAVQYTSGVPGSGGLGNVSLEVVVREQSTGYEEKTTRLIDIATAPVVLKVIPETLTFKPGLPLNLLVLATTPDDQPRDAQVELNLSYTKPDYSNSQETKKVTVSGGKALVKLTPPKDVVSLSIFAGADDANGTQATLAAGYSPSGAFVQVEQAAAQSLKVGDSARFHISATRGSGTFYYEVVARGEVVFSDTASAPDVEVTVTPAMAPRSRILVYQVQPNSEVAADYLPFDVSGDLPQKVGLSLSRDEVKPGEEVDVTVATDGETRVGLAAVDRSVFILAENRLNLQQVFAELERLYQTPQVELHSLSGGDSGPMPMDGDDVMPAIEVAPEAPAGGKPARGPVAIAPIAPDRRGIAPMPAIPGPMGGGKLATRGAKEVFADAGVVVLTSRTVPAGKEYDPPARRNGLFAGGGAPEAALEMQKMAVPAAAPQAARAADMAAREDDGGLAEVQRVRQFFPETWLWESLATGADGKAAKRVTAPDSITTWMFRAVALSKTAGLGVGEAQLRVLQPFFVSVDLPYAAIRGEELPVRIALYNYEERAADFTVEIEKDGWFELLDGATSARVRVGPSDVGAASFRIRPGKLGVGKLKVTARSAQSADAIVKELIVEPEGVAREVVENLVLTAPASRKLDIAFPNGIVSESGRSLIAVTGSYLTQSIAGLEGLIKMPFGCGEQNMINFAPNVYVTRYLKETNQTKPEVLAKSELMMTTGYQRQLTYRRSDGSFSAFGESDKDGSLWLTSFVLKTFAQAKGLIFIDDAVLASAGDWIARGQKPDGSFDPIGFVHHEELLGGLSGKKALSAFAAIALQEAGLSAAAEKAARYLEGALDDQSGAYALAIGGYALALAQSPRAGEVIDRLLKLGRDTEAGLSWDKGTGEAEPTPAANGRLMPPRPGRSAAVETTGYAVLALLARGDKLTASRAARWLVSQRNAYGGFGSTQDTVVGLQALAAFAASTRADVDATVALRGAGNWRKDLKVDASSADVLQSIELPADLGGSIEIEVAGKGQVVLQTVRRFSVPAAEEANRSVFDVKVDYGTKSVAVDDLITISTSVRYTPPRPIAAGMVVVDVAVPTGFAPETDTLDRLVGGNASGGGARIKRYDVAGRKVAIYIEDMKPNEEARFAFKARALYPVRAQAVTSTAYSYYRPEDRGEALGGAVVVAGR